MVAQSAEQAELRLRKSKSKRTVRAVPESLHVQAVEHDFPLVGEVPASVLLSWSDPKLQDSKFALPIAAEHAKAALSVMPPLVSAIGNQRSISGLVALTVALLKCLPGDQKVKVTYLGPEHPFANANVPLYQLLPAVLPEVALPTLVDIFVLLSGRRPSDSDLGIAIGKDRSTISRLRKRIENGT